MDVNDVRNLVEVEAALDGKVIDSCGCVFCDLELKAENWGGIHVHVTARSPLGYVRCTAPLAGRDAGSA